MLSGTRRCWSPGSTSGPLYRLAQSTSSFHLLYHPLEWYTVQAPFPAAGGVVAVEAVPTLGATAGAYELDAVAMTAGAGVHLLGDTPVIGDDSVAFYSSHIAPIRKSVVAEAWIALKPTPALLVAGVTSSPPGAATHRKVAR